VPLAATRDHGVVAVDDVRAWRDGGSFQLKAVTSSGDPVDLSGDEARRVAQELLALADEADAE
jgi:hypothetical protein